MLIVVIWPLFALIVLGWALSRRGWPAPGFWSDAERLNYFVLFPALLIASLADAPVGDPALIRMGGAAVATILIATVALWAVRAVRPWPAARFGPALQGVIRFNTYLGLAIVAAVEGTPGLERAAVLLAVAVPLVNVLSIVALTGGGRGPMALIRPMATNPLILACLIGLALAVTGAGLPWGIGRFLSLVGQASLPLGLICVGAALRPDTLRGDLVALSGVSALRLVVMPALAAAVGAIFGLPSTEAMVLIVFAAIPTAATAYVLTRQLNGDADLMAGLVTLQTLAAVATIPAMLAILT